MPPDDCEGALPLIPLVIRRYAPEDLDATIEMFVRAVRETASKDYTARQIAAWSAVDRDAWAKARGSRPTWLAVIDGTPAGFIDLEADGHLDMLYVHPSFQRRGVARALLETAEAAARSRAMPRLHSEASITALPFFARHGFHVIEEERVVHRGETFRRCRMVKPL